ncbi:hypothetical protein KKB99_03865 [bacterium]|nr:hypothetical protein [bacterium]MBU1025129.1 hypothetical protein [bacterium]
MKRTIRLIPMLLIIISLALGCSSAPNSPVEPSDSNTILDLPVFNVDESTSGHQNLGMWTLELNKEKQTLTASPNREAEAHFPVHTWINPVFTLITFDPLTGIAVVNATITNTFPISGYDVRLIVLTDNYGIRLLNADDWTSLWDNPAVGAQINPFKAFAKNEVKRLFSGNNTSHSEKLQLHFPPNSPTINIRIDASYPGNCEEPYEITNFIQEDLYYRQGSEAELKVDVHDWQNDVNAVSFWCPPITGSGVPLSFSKIDAARWGITLTNTTGAQAGEYTGCIFATSSNSGNLALFDVVKIHVSNESGVPSNPRLDGWWDVFYSSLYVAIVGNYAYVTDQTEGLKVVDISNPAIPDIVGYVDMPSSSLKLAIQGNYAYVAARGDGLKVVDISNPTKPVIVGGYDTPYDTHGVAVSGNFAYLADFGWGMIILNISDPENPVYVDDVYTSPNAQGVAYQNGFAYVSSGSEGLFKINVSDPDHPFIVSGWPVDTDDATNAVLRGNYAYVTDGSTGLRIINTSTPAPGIVGSCSTGGYAMDVVLLVSCQHSSVG